MVLTHNNTIAKENLLRFNPLNFQKSYRVEIVIEEENARENTKITYDAAVEVPQVFQSGEYLAAVTMTKFRVNGFEPDLMMEQLASKCRKPLEKVEFIVARNGELLRVHNHDEILEKWKPIKERLEIEYSGDIFEKYLNLTDKALQDKEAILAALKKDTFIHQYFYPLYNESFFNYTKKKVEAVRFFNISYEIDMVLELQKDTSLSGNITVVKRIDDKEYDYSKMPVDDYTTEYLLNENMEIINITGRFGNYGRKYSFRSIEKYKGR